MSTGRGTSSGYTAEWEEFPAETIESFTEAFNSSSGQGYTPYVQFYASGERLYAAYTVSLYPAVGTCNLTRGKIRPIPSELYTATLNSDGSVTFVNVDMELTVDERHRDLPLSSTSVVITPTGEIVAMEL
jgi:hypothetical protein